MGAGQPTRISETGPAAVALVALHLLAAWASLAGRADLWGLAPWLGAERGQVLVWLLLPLPVLGLEWFRRTLGPRLRHLLAAAFLVAGPAGLWLFRDALSLDGDGRLLLAEIAGGEARSTSAPWLNELLLALAGLGRGGGWGDELTLRAASVLAGAVFVLLATLLWRREPDSNGSGLLVFLASPFVLLFAGWIELYPFVWLAGLTFLGIVLRSMTDARAFFVALGLATLLPAIHPSLVLLLPALLVPAWLGPAHPRLRGRVRLVTALLALVVAAANRALLVGSWPASEFLGGVPERLPYGVLDPRHFLETAWLVLLLAPAAVALPFLRGKLDPADRVLLVAAGSALAGGFLVLPVLGYARDWDLMALPALPLALFAARRVERIAPPWFAALVLGLVVARTVGWIGVHHDPEAALRRAAAIADEAWLNSDFARSHLHDDLSHVLESRGRPEDAIVHAVAAASLRPDAARMHYRVGYLARRYGDPAVAERSLALAVRLEPEFFDARHELGMALVGRSAWEEAMVHLRAASDLRPADIRVRANLAVTLINAGRVDEAAPEVRYIAASPDPARERALANVVRALEAAGAADAAARVRELL